MPFASLAWPRTSMCFSPKGPRLVLFRGAETEDYKTGMFCDAKLLLDSFFEFIFYKQAFNSSCLSLVSSPASPVQC